MMRKSCCALVVALGCMPYTTGASIAKWVQSPTDPLAIVVGHLIGISPASFEQITEFPQPLSGMVAQSVDLYSCGTVAVDSVLWGDRSATEFALCWVSGNVRFPNIEELWTWDFGVRDFQVGDCWIFVIRQEVEFPGRSGVRFNEFEALDLEHLDGVVRDIASRWPD